MLTEDQIEMRRARSRRYEAANREKRREKSRQWKEANKERVLEYARSYRLANPEKIQQANAEAWKSNPGYFVAKNREWRERNRASYNAKRREALKQKMCDPQFRIAKNLRARLNQAVKRGAKRGSAVSDLGCSVLEFKSYIESLFLPNMSWDNYGEWHLDHIMPLAVFDLTDRDQFLQAAHWTNYQPLWAMDNYVKYCNTPAQIQTVAG